MPVNVTTNSNKDTSKVNGEDESSNSEGDSSSYDEDESERRKSDCLDDIQYLEQQFSDLKELLYKEKLEEINDKIQRVTRGNAPEYLDPQRELQKILSQRLNTLDTHLQCKVRNIENKFEEESISSEQNYKELCEVTRQRMIADVQDKIFHLQEHTVSFNENSARKRKIRANEFQLPEKRKKPVTVTGPCVVYMLRDIDIMEDLSIVKKGRVGAGLDSNVWTKRRKTGGGLPSKKL